MIGNKFWTLVLILLFGGAMVFIGHRDLRRELAKSPTNDPEQTKILLKDLRGDVDVSRASLRRQEENSVDSEPSGIRKWFNNVVKTVAP